MSGTTLFVETKEVVRLRLWSSVLCIDVPDVPEFNGAHALSGLAGNIDNICVDDFVWK